MVEPPRGPLAHLDEARLQVEGPDGEALAIAPRADRIRLLLRARGEDVDALGRVLGGPLPSQPNTTVACAAGRLFWLGPDEWLAEFDPASAAGPLRALDAFRPARPIAAVDVTHALAGFDLSGPLAVELLRKGCPLDLDPGRFLPGACARTLLGKADVLLWRQDGGFPPRFGVATDRSYADHVWHWLADAAREFLPVGLRPASLSPRSATTRHDNP